MTKIANEDAEDNPTTGAANTLRAPDGTAATAHDPTFFGLPRELRDEIYTLAALSEHTLYREIILRAGCPPQKSAHVGQDAHRTLSDSQFEIEYSAAAERRVRSLMNGGGIAVASSCADREHERNLIHKEPKRMPFGSRCRRKSRKTAKSLTLSTLSCSPSL